MIKQLRYFIFTLLLIGSCYGVVAHADIKPLAIDQAFQFTAQVKDQQTLIFNWNIAPGYYLYKHRFHFKIIDSPNSHLSSPLFPLAINKHNESLGDYSVYIDTLSLPVPILQSYDSSITVQVGYQGCSQQGFCYPPVVKNVNLNLTGHFMTPTNGTDVIVSIKTAPQPTTHYNQTSHLTRLLAKDNIFLIIVIFLGLGVLMSLTPCVLPMIPILSSIIVGQQSKAGWHTFSLSLAYVLGMAIAYALAGVMFGLLGANIQPFLQSQWVIIIFSGLFVLMGLAMLGLFQIQLPQALRNRIANAGGHQTPGSYLRVFFMGLLASLILSPCVTPPLVGVLAYISHQGSVFIGALALFSLGLGIGAPLLIIGALGSQFLPKAGRWMEAINTLMGLLLFAVAIWLLNRILPNSWGLSLWSAWIVLSAICMGAFKTAHGARQLIRKIFAILIFIYGLLIFVGMLTHSENPWLPTQLKQTKVTLQLKFTKVYSLAELQTALDDPAYKNKPILLDFYADWCASCQQLKHFTFSNPLVMEQLNQMVLLQADLTHFNAASQKLMQHYGVIAPPTLLFFDKNHQPLPTATIVGEISAKDLLLHLKILP